MALSDITKRPDYQDNTTYFLIENSNYVEEMDEDSVAGDFYLNNIIDLKGKKPVDGFIKIGDNGEVKKAEFILDGYQVECIIDICKVIDKINMNEIPDITLSVSKDKIDLKETLKLNVTLSPNKVTPTYQSSNESVAVISSDGTITPKAPGDVTITVKAGIRKKKIDITVLPNNSLIGIASTYKENSDKETIVINGVTYTAHVYYFEGDQVWTENKIFGTSADIGTSTTNASNMIIVKVNGNLTINNGVHVTTNGYDYNYGGPKGLLLYVTGTIYNHGYITMTGRGAKAAGQNVYLWKNANDAYEYIPANGAAGATSKSIGVGLNNEKRAITVNNGSNGTARSTGGGGGGGLAECNGYIYDTISAAGGRGTSYAGGGGGGGAAKHSNSGKLTPINSTGIQGTNAVVIDGSYDTFKSAAGGGAGIPAGVGKKSTNAVSAGRGGYGSGGLLIIYANELQLYSTAKYNSLGISGGAAKGGGGSGDYGSAATGGGGSGGGSINIFANNIVKNDVSSLTSIYDVNGGAGGVASGATYNGKGGAGGKGTFSIGKIVNGSYQAYSF